MTEIILASASPRRQKLLSLTGLPFRVFPSDVDESLEAGISPGTGVQILAHRKAKALIKQFPNALIIGADTTVALDDQIFGKPVSEDDAFHMLQILSGKTHQVYTGVALLVQDQEHIFVESTDVTFYPLSDRMIWDYIATGEPMDKAGAYGIQGKGGLFVQSIHGDYNNVVGLPVGRLLREIQARYLMKNDIERVVFMD